MDISATVERLLTGFEEGHARLEETLTALRATCDDVRLTHRSDFFTQVLMRFYREAVTSGRYQRVIPILHSWAAFGPADELPTYLYSMRGFACQDVAGWVREILPIFRFVLGDHAERFSDAVIEIVEHDCQTLGNPEPLLGQSPLNDDLNKGVQALASTARYIRHQRLLRTIGQPERAQEPKEYDDLVPLYRRRVFDVDLPRELGAATAAAPLSLLFLDLDKFKKINDEHGHQTGDEVLIACAQFVHQAANRKGTAYRYGGEELAVILPNFTTAEALIVAERIRSSIAQAKVTDKAVSVTVSIGIAAVPAHATSPKALLEAADQALYEAKHLGRDRVCIAGGQQ